MRLSAANIFLFMLGLMSFSFGASADIGLNAVTVATDANGGQTYSLTIQILALMTVMSVLPSALLMMTSFMRIVIVLAILRQALGTQQTPNNQVIIGLALFLTMFIMMPVFDSVYEESVAPYLEEKISIEEATVAAGKHIRGFMLHQTRESDIELFASIAGVEDLGDHEDVPFSLLIPAFATSELKTAFQIGFLLFIPFLVVDLVIASVLMSMGMMMLSPMIISLPFKLMLFVLVDGWALVMGTLASSFFM